MNTLLWILQALLALIFLITGTVKLSQPREKLAAGMMKWAKDVSDTQFRAVGTVELLGAAGLILPGWLMLLPVLTPLAATGLAATMVGAAATHARLNERDRLAVPLILLAVALFIAIERFGPHSL